MNESRESLLAYLQQVADFMESHNEGQWRSVERMVLDHGVDGEWSPRPPDVEAGRAKECFGNAFWLARERDWIYVEGFVLSGRVPVPIHHAWCLDPEGRVVETTLREPGDTECAFCLGDGEVAVEIEPADEDDDWIEHEHEPCGFCDATGVHDEQREPLDDSFYRGVPFTAEVAARAIIDSGIYGVLTSPLVLGGDLSALVAS